MIEFFNGQHVRVNYHRHNRDKNCWTISKVDAKMLFDSSLPK